MTGISVEKEREKKIRGCIFCLLEKMSGRESKRDKKSM